MRDDFDEARFRAWVLKELETSATLMKEDKERGLDTYKIHFGMIRGIRHVVQHLGIFDRSELRDYEQHLKDGIADDELRSLVQGDE